MYVWSVRSVYKRVTVAERAAPPPAPAPPPPPPPPPAPPTPVSAPAPPRTTDTTKSNKSLMSGSGDLHEELKMVLPAIQARKKMLDIKKTPDIFIDQKSNPDEVAEWLEAKGFSAATQRALRMPGHQLFALTRPQLEKALGTDEGKRLYSQILVQRNVSGVSRRLYVQDNVGVRAAEYPAQGAREGGGIVSARALQWARSPHALPHQDDDDDASTC